MKIVQSCAASKTHIRPLAVSVKTAAALLEFSEKTIRRLIDDQSLKAIRHGRLLRIPVAQLKKFIEG